MDGAVCGEVLAGSPRKGLDMGRAYPVRGLRPGRQGWAKAGWPAGEEDVRRRMEAGGQTKRLRVLGDGGEGNADPIGGHRKVHPAVQGGKTTGRRIAKGAQSERRGRKAGLDAQGGLQLPPWKMVERKSVRGLTEVKLAYNMKLK